MKIQLDIVDVVVAQADADRIGLKMNVIDMVGPGGGNPLVEFEGEPDNVKEYVDLYSNDSDDAKFLMEGAFD